MLWYACAIRYDEKRGTAIIFQGPMPELEAAEVAMPTTPSAPLPQVATSFKKRKTGLNAYVWYRIEKQREIQVRFRRPSVPIAPMLVSWSTAFNE